MHTNENNKLIEFNSIQIQQYCSKKLTLNETQGFNFKYLVYVSIHLLANKFKLEPGPASTVEYHLLRNFWSRGDLGSIPAKDYFSDAIFFGMLHTNVWRKIQLSDGFFQSRNLKNRKLSSTYLLLYEGERSPEN